ncbi:sensor histidine kinase [Haloglomus salinum]|jgi:signal transduction histidine kinase|uniref:sensor histidine kinase n=1 Tax=Haloglomus salinum TaxID=2962673 RepID=UPI0020CA0190|nr:hybrid sensor histidine kinase/response regulator [Haloglomus salinum]
MSGHPDPEMTGPAATDADDTTEEADGPVAFGGRSLQVLLVEDNSGDATLIETHLDRVSGDELGTELSLTHVETLTAALDRLATDQFDVVLLDLGLPESTGLETAERVLDAYPAVPVVVLTGLQNEEVALEAIRAGAQDYLDKNEHIEGPMLARAVRYAVERKAREKQLELRTERLGEFAELISHELRNPLSIASGYVQLARDGDADTADALAEIDDAIDRIGTLVDKLHRLTSLSTADGVAPVDFETTAAERWAATATPGATLETADGLPTIAANPDRIRSLFDQLFRNAIEHGGEDVTVEVGPLPDEDGFYVADDGPGIPPEERGDLFEHGSTGGSDPSFGLPIVRNVAEDHGWEVRAVESASGGARFEVAGLSNTLTELRRNAGGHGGPGGG